MLVLVSYDICAQTDPGAQRFERVTKACAARGQRVQNALFECMLSVGQSQPFERELIGLIDPKTDSLRLYYLGNNQALRIRHIGAKQKDLPNDVWRV